MKKKVKSVYQALYTLFFQKYANASYVRGGSGHYNEQCHPQTYN